MCQSTPRGGGGTRSQVQVGGVPGPGPDRGVRGPGPGRGGSQVQVRGVPGLRLGGVGGYPVSGPGGGPGLSKGKIFGHQIWLDTCSDWKKKFLSRDPPPHASCVHAGGLSCF